jgi:hypothetical protein
VLAGAPRDAALIGDLSKIRDTRAVAEQANSLGEFDAVIHKANSNIRPGVRIFTAAIASRQAPPDLIGTPAVELSDIATPATH